MKSFFSKIKKLRLVPSAYCLVALLIPVLLVFKNIFFGNLPTWGDAPYFFPETMKELLREPSGWVERGVNFGGVNLLLWISPLMLLYGILGSILNLGNDIAVKLIFYFPAIVLSVITPILLTRYLKLSKKVQFFSSLFYSINTYFILLIDGGQVGVALAYGLFPLVLLFLKKLVDKPSLNSFLLGLLLLFIQGVADPRVALICLFTAFLWLLIERKNVLYLIALFAAWLATSAYWIYPLLKNGYQNIGIGVSDLNFVTLLDSLLLHQSHFPTNVFGKLFSPPFYFVGIPVLIVCGLLIGAKKKIHLQLIALYLLFAFIAKGSNAPLGSWYQFLVEQTPFGFVFRDSSKFFTPLVLFTGILIGYSIEKFTSLIKNQRWPFLITVFCYFYLLFLVAPALLGKLNFVLSNRKHSQDYQTIYENLKKDEGFYRSVWFPEKYPLTYDTSNNPMIEAKSLVNSRPFASLNASEDAFNFLNDPGFIDWFRILGIKYLVLSGNPRSITPNLKDVESWETEKYLIVKTPGLEKKEWGVSIPVYEVKDTKPKIFAFGQLTAVVGSELVPRAYSLVPSVYFEDGKFDPLLLEGKNKDSVKILFNEKDESDLAMSFLQKYFISFGKSDWAGYESNDYLKYKYQFLIRGIVFRDFDYGKGIAFSTEPNEKIEYDLEADKDGEYVLAVRVMGEGLKLDFNGTQVDIKASRKNNLYWNTQQVNLKKGIHKLILENRGGTQITNVAALVPISEWSKVQSLTKTYLIHFGTTTGNKLSDKFEEMEFKKVSPVSYEITAPLDSYWIILTDSYHPEWNLKQGPLFHKSLPVYSMLNAFYTEPAWANIKIVFKGQDNFRWGVWFSVVTALSLAIIYLYLKAAKK